MAEIIEADSPPAAHLRTFTSLVRCQNYWQLTRVRSGCSVEILHLFYSVPLRIEFSFRIASAGAWIGGGGIPPGLSQGEFLPYAYHVCQHL